MIDDAFRAEYNAAISVGAYFRRDDRGLIEVSGADRADWLNNLVTNVVKTLTPGEGNYAFCINVKGRVVFDLNILVRQDSLWLDIDRRWIDTAMKWLDRYVITEDVVLKDLSDRHERFAVIGPAAAKVCAALRFGNLVPKAWLQHESRDIGDSHVMMFRHDFTGLVGAEFVVIGDSRQVAVEQVESSALASDAARISARTVDVLRMEAGIPASIADIDEDVIPPETGQVERGISYQKGCYLGQEVLERMRSRGGLARKLVGIRLDGPSMPEKNAPILAGGAESGRVTSVGYSLALDAVLALGYVRSGQSAEGADVIVRDDGAGIPGTIVGLPVRR